MRIGVYICRVGVETGDGANLEAVGHYMANLPQVESVRSLGLLPRIDPEAMADEIAADELDRIVIAGDSPGFFKPAFTRAMSLAGREPDEVRLASFREHGVSGDGATERAKAIAACAVYGVPFTLAARPMDTKWNPATLVIGGGIAGIQAALEIADGGKKVYLVERTGTIGGHMAMFDKTFPTLDCAACILTPKMVAVGQHPMIELLSYSEVESISGVPGAYRATVLRHARRVKEDACVACGICSDVCPVKVPSEFDAGIADRKAIYIPFPQAVPNAYLVDEASCTFVQTNGQKCGACAKKCPKECIDLDARGEVLQLEVGSVIVATGYEVLDASRLERYGYGVQPNVLTALEFERLTNASGPTGGQDRHQVPPAQQAQEGRRVGVRPRRGVAEERRHHPLCRFAGRELQRLLLARLLHVLPQVRAPREGEAAGRRLLRVLHRHARLREGLRGLLRTHPGRGHLHRPRPVGDGDRPCRPDGHQGRGHPERQRRGIPRRHGAAGRRARPCGTIGRARAHARRRLGTSTDGSRRSTTTAIPRAPSAAACTWRASARGQRTSPTPWPRRRRWPRGPSRAP